MHVSYVTYVARLADIAKFTNDATKYQDCCCQTLEYHDVRRGLKLLCNQEKVTIQTRALDRASSDHVHAREDTTTEAMITAFMHKSCSSRIDAISGEASANATAVCPLSCFLLVPRYEMLRQLSDASLRWFRNVGRRTVELHAHIVNKVASL